jgi:hypothetical protein
MSYKVIENEKGTDGHLKVKMEEFVVNVTLSIAQLRPMRSKEAKADAGLLKFIVCRNVGACDDEQK